VTSLPAWAVREPDEPPQDWLTRLVISLAAIRAHTKTKERS
jgi:hypothetical protein